MIFQDMGNMVLRAVIPGKTYHTSLKFVITNYYEQNTPTRVTD